MGRLPQLENADTYRPCEWDLKVDAQGRRYWVDLFRGHIDTLTAAIREAYPDTPESKLGSFRNEYLATMATLHATPSRFERIDILVLDELRTDLQTRFGFHDPYHPVKQRENELALGMLPELLAELDECHADHLDERLASGLMAGNIFDLGATAAVERFRANGSDFRRLRAAQPPRPWLIDDLDHWCERWRNGPAYAHVGFFVDNAGSDICLGCLPMVRWMLRAGSRVTLAANTTPALNDVTAPELESLLEHVSAIDPIFRRARAAERLSVVETGGRAPLIDLTQLTSTCVDALADADLIVLLGMGRAVESNFRVRLSCDCLRAAVLKDAEVARWVGGTLFDCIFQFQPAR